MEIKVEKYKLTMTTPILGSWPRNQEVFTRFIQDQLMDEDKKQAEIEALSQEDAEARQGATTFAKMLDGRLCMVDYQIKGFLKEGANLFKDSLAVKYLRSKIGNFVFVFPQFIPFFPDKTEPDGVYERTLRVMTAQGPRVTLAKSDMLNAGVSVNVEIHILENKEKIDHTMIEKIFEYGKYQGLLQFRSGSYGRFIWEKISEPKIP